MTKSFLIALAAASVAALAACSPKPAAETAAPPAPGDAAATAPATGDAMASGDMSKMAPAAEVKTGQGTGVVTAIDKAAGTITLEHGPIDAVGWPAMTMAFKANPPSQLDTVKVGDRVAFDVKTGGGVNEVSGIRKP